MKPIYLVYDEVAYRVSSQDGLNEVADMIARGTRRARLIMESEFQTYREKVTDCIDDRIGAVIGAVFVFYVWLG